MAGIDWYSAGTIAVANGGSVVTGSGTNWLIDPQFNGAGILLPDGLIYEITDLTSATALNIKPNYKGTTVGSGGAYQIAPIQGWARSTGMQITTLMAAASDLLSLNPADKDIIQGRAESGAVAWTTRNPAQYSYDIFTGPPELNVASAATCDIGQAISHRIQITGTTTITSMGTVPNCIRYVRFGGVITIVYNPTTLILPGKANITTAAGDNAIFTSDNVGNWRCIGFVRVTTPVMGGDYFWDENLAHGVKATNINAGPLTSVNFEVSNGMNSGEIMQTGTGYAATGGLDGADLTMIRAKGAGGMSIVATQAGAPLRFGTNAIERMRIAASGNVGIGAAAPDVFIPDANGLVISGSLYGSLVLTGPAGSGPLILFMRTDEPGIQRGVIRYNTVDETMTFTTHGANRLRIEGNGQITVLNSSDATTAVVVSGATKGLRLGTNTTGAVVEGVDPTGGASYQPLSLGGSDIRFNTIAERMRIDANGSVMIAGTTTLSSTTKLTVYNQTDDPVAFAVKGAASSLRIGNNGNIASVDAVDAVNGNSAWKTLQLSGLDLRAVVNSTERARITAGGFLKVSNTGNYWNAAALYHELNNYADGNPVAFFNHHNNPNPSGIVMLYPQAAPNDAAHNFVTCGDSGPYRFLVYSNGGIGNFSANNVNISDVQLKTEISPYTDADLDALEASFVSVDWGKFKFADQTHEDWNHGYTAQGVEAAFAASAPELVDETKLGVPNPSETAATRKCVYDADLTHIAHALLARALKRIAQLEAQI